MEIDEIHKQVYQKFSLIQGQVLVGVDAIKVREPDNYVNEEHNLHDMVRGFYKPKEKKYLISYLATESDENYGKQIEWENKEKFTFNLIIMRPPSSPKDVRRKGDIEAARNNLKYEIPIGILYKVKASHYAILGLGKIIEERSNGDFVVVPYEFNNAQMEESDILNHIYSYINSKGFNYSLSNIKNLYLSLRSKPFVIISGISGTGKTKIVQLFAESLGATEDNGQFKLIPVRPDWTDSSELLGYVDLKGDFIEGPLTKMIEHALDNPLLPHFVLLDEMNLARVEYYFSDLLSVMESRRRVGDKITSSNLLDEKYTGRAIRLPENLYIIGTVNMDETTHPFSKKVLDRANTIEFNDVYLTNFDYLEGSDEIVDPIRVTNDQLKPTFLSLKDIYSSHKYLVQKVSQNLDDINRKLESINAHVGYRVRDEVCFYMVHNQDADLLDEKEAFDLCLMQKILPRITGSDHRVEELLKQLYEQFTGVPFDATNVQDSGDYPMSVKKIVEMLRRHQSDGFTSFWIS